MRGMEIQLIRATVEDAEELLHIQKESFQTEYERYQDERSPFLMSLERMRLRINYPESAYYRIVHEDTTVGGIWVYEKEPGFFRLNILYVLPQYQSRGIGQRAIAMVEALHDAVRWELDCPEDLPANRRCYERAGYRLTGEREIINEKLTLVYYGKLRQPAE